MTLLAASTLVLTDCDTFGYGSSMFEGAACPELTANVDALTAVYASDARLNAKVRAFVSASKDLATVAAQAEAEAAEACIRIGTDMGMSLAEMQPRNEAGGRASGACAAVAGRMDMVLRGQVGFQAIVTPPQCQANLEAQSRCSGVCNAQGQASSGQASGDAECDASCSAQANLRAQCTPLTVVVRPLRADPALLRLAASLQANLPQLLHAELVLGKRVIASAETLVQVGQNLPQIVSRAGVRAAGCVAGAASASVRASASIKVTVQASAQVSMRGGAGS